MKSNELGRVTKEGERASVFFQREIEAPSAKVWGLIATSEGLEQWLAPSRIDLRIGGEFDVDFGEDGLAGGTIIELQKGKTLEYHWRFEGEPDSIIRFELEDLGDRTRLTLLHRLLPVAQSNGYGAGWHAHLDQLITVSRGGERFDWMTRLQELMPDYST